MQTPLDLAISISDMPTSTGGVNNPSWNYTQSPGVGGYSMDDSRQWDY